MSEIIKLPVYYNSAYFAIKDTGNQSLLRLQISHLPLSEQIKVGDFVAEAINSYGANRQRIEELEAEKFNEYNLRIKAEKRVIELEDKLRLGK